MGCQPTIGGLFPSLLLSPSLSPSLPFPSSFLPPEAGAGGVVRKLEAINPSEGDVGNSLHVGLCMTQSRVLWCNTMIGTECCSRFSLQCTISVCRSYESMVVGKTPASRKIGEDLLVVVQYVDKPPVNTTRFFVYRQNPDVINIFPLSHLLRYA